MNSTHRPTQRRAPRKPAAWNATAAALLLAACAALAEQTIEIRRTVLPSGPDVLLKDLALIPSALPKEWADRSVLPSPEPCKPQRVPLSTVAYALQNYPDMKNVTLRGDLNVTVQREGAPIDTVLVETAIRRFVAERDAVPDSSLRIDIVRIPSDFRVPLGAIDIDVLRSRLMDNLSGAALFDLQVRAEDSTMLTTTVQACVQPLHEFWVARTRIERGQPISPDNVEKRLLPTNGPSRHFIPCGELVDGLEAGRDIVAGQPLVREYIHPPLCASRGDVVNISAEVKNLRVTLRAKALSDGRLGERILCLNEQSKRRILVHITGQRTATLTSF